jgi:hypothetical protein
VSDTFDVDCHDTRVKFVYDADADSAYVERGNALSAHPCDGRRPRRGSNPELELQKRSCANQEAIGSLW